MTDEHPPRDPDQYKRAEDRKTTTWVTTRDLARTLADLGVEAAAYTDAYRAGYERALMDLRQEYHLSDAPADWGRESDERADESEGQP